MVRFASIVRLCVCLYVCVCACVRVVQQSMEQQMQNPEYIYPDYAKMEVSCMLRFLLNSCALTALADAAALHSGVVRSREACT